MRTKTYLMLANSASLVFILVFLLISYRKMLLSYEQTVWLSVITIGAGLLSAFMHFLIIRPIERSISQLSDGAVRIAAGQFDLKLPQAGPKEFRLLAEQFNAMSEKLESSFAEIRYAEKLRKELVANVSHDLRTPMASIQAFVEALQDDVIRDRAEFDNYLTAIRLETHRLNGLIEDLFHLSRLEANAEPFRPEPLSIEELLLEAIQSMVLKIDAKQVTLHVDTPDREERLIGDGHQLKRVLANLLSNAVRHSPMGGRILIRTCRQDDRYLKIDVLDEGSGVPPSERERLFDRFYRSDKSRNRESGGAGLGLAIAKSIVERHGGSIGIESEPGWGSCFWFTLPLDGVNRSETA